MILLCKRFCSILSYGERLRSTFWMICQEICENFLWNWAKRSVFTEFWTKFERFCGRKKRIGRSSSTFFITLSKIHFDKDNLECLVSHIISCQDEKETISLLNVFKAVNIDFQYCWPVSDRISEAGPHLFCEILRTILNYDSRNLIAEWTAQKINKQHFTLEFLTSLIPVILEFPESVRIFSIIVANMGAFDSHLFFFETVRKLTLDIEWLKRWMQIDHLYIWPIISVLGLGNNSSICYRDAPRLNQAWNSSTRSLASTTFWSILMSRVTYGYFSFCRLCIDYR
jgi:hypothetical protein